MIHSRVALAAILLTAACSRSAPEDPPGAERVLTRLPSPAPVQIETYAGHLTLGFEQRVFVPCGSQDQWWLEAEGDIPGRLKKAGGPDAFKPELRGVVFFLRGRGRLSGLGHFGHLGAFAKELTLVEVVELRAQGKSDCALPIQ
jgi:hypothetical protein